MSAATRHVPGRSPYWPEPTVISVACWPSAHATVAGKQVSTRRLAWCLRDLVLLDTQIHIKIPQRVIRQLTCDIRG